MHPMMMTVALHPIMGLELSMPQATTPSIERVAISALRPYPGNARTHSKKQIAQIADSISRFGFYQPRFDQ